MKNFEEDCIKYNFTEGQKIAVSAAIDFIAKPFDNKFVIGINGAGGVGKTYITDYIIRHCKYSASLIQCCSPTHKACRVFSQAMGGLTVNTIQSTFGFRLNLKLEDFDPARPQFNPMASPKLEDTKVLIIDEVSMLPAKLVNYILKVCRESQIKVIGLGDGHQLAPVNEKKSTFFDKCSAVYTLTEIVRQKADNPISKLLKILRQDIENKTYKFLEYLSRNIGGFEYNENAEGWCCVRANQFKDYIETCFNDEEYTKNIDLYRIIAYTNKAVANWNKFVRNIIVQDANKKIITQHDLIMCYETIVDEFLSEIINNSEEYIIKDIVDYVDNKYGFKGFLIKFQKVNGGNITKPLFVINHKDKYTVQKYYQVLTDLINIAKKSTSGNRTSKWKDYYNFKKSYLIAANIENRNGDILVQRDLDYGFAITSHKSQGSTYNTVFVDVNDMVYDKNGNIYNNQDDLLRRLYVACSRAKSNLVLCYGY